MNFSEQLMNAVTHAFKAHTHQTNDPAQALRWLDGTTPYAVHPLGSATLLAMEPDLPEDLRHDGALALVCHDLLEDTNAGLPEGLPERAAEWVRQMTFKGKMKEYEPQIWQREPFVRLLIFVEKFNTLFDGNWMSDDRLRYHCEFLTRLADDVEGNFGTLNVVVTARALVRHRLEHGFRTRSKRPA